jgi:hypothetical protein
LDEATILLADLSDTTGSFEIVWQDTDWARQQIFLLVNYDTTTYSVRVQNLDASGAPKGEPLAEVKRLTAKDEELNLSLDLPVE